MRMRRCSPHIFGNMAAFHGSTGSCGTSGNRSGQRSSVHCQSATCSSYPAGVPRTDRDMTAAVIAGTGEVLVHGIAIAPGSRPSSGRSGRKPVFGLPGHPAAAFVVLIAIVCPLLDRMLGLRKPMFRTTAAVLGENIPSQKGREEYVRVRLAEGIAFPVLWQIGPAAHPHKKRRARLHPLGLRRA